GTAGGAIPADVSRAVNGYDMLHHPGRNIPDATYGPVVVDGKKNKDGSWTVRVGSMRTSIAGPLPGISKKPFDIVEYTYKHGKVTEAHGAAAPKMSPAEWTKKVKDFVAS